MFGKELMYIEERFPPHDAFKAVSRGHEFRFVIEPSGYVKVMKIHAPFTS
jgi:hypothetical protein